MDPVAIGIGVLVGATLMAFVLNSVWRARAASTTVRLEERDREASHLRTEITHLAMARERAEDAARVQETTAECLRTELEAERLRGEERIAALQEADSRLRDAFRVIAGDVLKDSKESFLQLAGKTFEGYMKEARGELGKRGEEIGGVIRPLKESLSRYETHLRELEEKRQKAFVSLEEQMKMVTGTQQLLQQETRKLVNALRRPEVRGQWGEMALRRVVELAGMSEHCDFDIQTHLGSEEGALRPDMIVRLPSQRSVVVDAKVPLDAYLSATEAESDDQRREALERHAAQVRRHVERLGRKDYWNRLDDAPEFVVMFIPESFFFAALQVDSELLEYGMGNRVVIATPTTLIALLWAVAYGWRQEELNRNAREVQEHGSELYERLVTWQSHLAGVAKHLGRTVGSFNEAVGSLEHRVFPSVRRFRDLGVSTSKELPPLKPLATTPREVARGALGIPDDGSTSQQGLFENAEIQAEDADLRREGSEVTRSGSSPGSLDHRSPGERPGADAGTSAPSSGS